MLDFSKFAKVQKNLENTRKSIISLFNLILMIICKTVSNIQSVIKKRGEFGKKIGFVPTMGALHQGHVSLINKSKQETDFTVCSIFVNPTQFNDPNDFEKYPITIDQDILKLEKAGCDVLFLPSVNEIYPNGIKPNTFYQLGFLETVLEGSFRPNHFQGVCQVVERLLRIVEPNILFLGQKDYQQCMVINQLIEIMGWQNKLQLHIADTLREPSGLAMSSRNMRLSAEEKENAVAIYQSLRYLKDNFSNVNFSELIIAVKEKLTKVGFSKIDYIVICNAKNLEEQREFKQNVKFVALIAAFAPNGVRLIDNMLLN